MLSHLRHVFFRFRVVLGAIRNGIYGLALVCAGWIFVAPPSPSEIARLDLPPSATAQNDALRAHRMAKLLMMVGTDRMYDLVADRSDTGLSADEVRLGVILAAEGTPLRADEVETPTRSITGAKFEAARTN